MRTFRAVEDLPSPPIEPVATMGNFDGLHRGHQALLGRLREEAARLDAPTMVITYHPHPRSVLRPEEPFHQIAPLSERLRILEELSIDYALVIPFDEDFAELTATEFVEEILWDALRVRAMYIGPNTAFGYKRGGDPSFLASEGQRLGFAVGVVDPIFHRGRRIASSWVREAILRGDMEMAARLLGRHHGVSGEVVRGDERGRELGMPTANLHPEPGHLVPPPGIYATWVRLDDGRRLPAATSIGYRPTFDTGEEITFEVHVLGLDEDLYGRRLDVGLVRRLRDELRFEHVAALKRQMNQDVEETRRVLGVDRR